MLKKNTSHIYYKLHIIEMSFSLSDYTELIARPMYV